MACIKPVQNGVSHSKNENLDLPKKLCGKLFYFFISIAQN